MALRWSWLVQLALGKLPSTWEASWMQSMWPARVCWGCAASSQGMLVPGASHALTPGLATGSTTLAHGQASH